MENILIIYKSKYGAAREYAQLLGKALATVPVSIDQAKSQMITSADIIILCGGIYAASIAGLSFLKKNAALLSGKKTAVFAVGASPYDQKTLEELKKRHLSGALDGVPLFYGRGAWNEEIMTAKDKFLCSSAFFFHVRYWNEKGGGARPFRRIRRQFQRGGLVFFRECR